ncbi:hypothetical protein EIN_223900 [Entamoeba invadens IP1]|uniref:Autophagy-related protein 9 n=1 Tax=Entamoeba invadens IP1 TaxID=370355 RepID=A0A0A1U284_ENTIV|nr:hypothetical protein EIN_223900 [Entamoeba invadens IP1]ELP88167.1 hypothetical protein EIN_223900 [Entamoeba invadens IP1]|eukprot:XP_004254938.1 hypothetical protein EIN_223900 [Entamoeba invadens IP1]
MSTVNELQLPEECLKELYTIWKCGGYTGLVFDKLMRVTEKIVLLVVGLIMVSINYNKLFSSEFKGDAISSYFVNNEQRSICKLVLILIFLPILVREFYIFITSLSSTKLLQAKCFYEVNHFEDFNKNWDGIVSVVAPFHGYDRRSFVCSKSSVIDPKTNSLIRSSIVWKENLMTLIYNEFDFLQAYPTKYTMKIVENIFFPPFFTQDFCKRVKYDVCLQNVWKH